jgi:hypothetical protein
MKNKYVWIIIVLLVAAILLFRPKEPSAPTEQIEVTPTPIATEITTEVPQEATNPAPEVLSFKTLFVGHKTYSVDGSAPKEFSCPAFLKPNFRIQLDPNTTAEVACSSFDGVRLVFKTATQEKEEVDVAQIGADAGDAWDLRSSFTYTNGHLQVASLAYASTSDDTNIKCNANTNTVVWDSTTKEFTKLDIVSSIKKLDPPIAVDKKCLDSAGNWNPKN